MGYAARVSHRAEPRPMPAPQIIGPFSVEKSEGWTGCECPESLCTHGDEGMRPYYTWIVWDVAADDYASHTRGLPGRPLCFQDEYDLKRDAVADVRRYLAAAADLPPERHDEASLFCGRCRLLTLHRLVHRTGHVPQMTCTECAP